MTDPRSPDRARTALRDALVEQLRRTHAGDPWYGSSRTHLLHGLEAADASRRPPGSAHSIWELVLHMTAWTNEVRSRLDGTPPREPPEGDWPAPAGEGELAWADALARLERAHLALIARIEQVPDDELHRVVGEERDPALGTGVTVAGMLVGIAQHDAYHTGQVALLRRALGK